MARQREGVVMAVTRGSGIAIWYDVVGTGPLVVLLHGMMGRSDAWRIEGYVDGLCDAHELVLVDARGHGRSARPSDPEDYRAHCHARDVLAVMDDLGLASAALCGWSMGSITALRVAATAPARATAVVALGAAPEYVGFVDVPPPPEDEEDEDGLASRFEHKGMAGIAAELEQDGHSAWARLVARADPLAMAACDRGLSRPEPAGARLVDLEMPLLVAWGESEVRPGDAALLPAHARLVVVPGADHVGAFRRVDVLLPELRAFLAGVTAPAVPAGAS